jgi:hypothetical protein
VWQNQNNLPNQLTVPLQGDQLLRLSIMVAQGLHYLETNQIGCPAQNNSSTWLPVIGETEILKVIASAENTDRAFCEVKSNWGEGTFTYVGYLKAAARCESIWALEFYGGVETAGEGKFFTERIWVWLGQKRSNL